MALMQLEPSPRETEVLSLLGEHLSNAQVAQRLFISERTVETHVSSLLRKLGLRDRRALAVYASEQVAADALQLHRPAEPPTSFVGREAELAELASALSQQRLVTLVGPGGVGKTRLLLRAMEGRRVAFADLAVLARGSDQEAVARAVAGALGMVEPGASALSAVSKQLAAVPVALVLDNCEHVLDGAAALARHIWASTPNLVVATSRERLGLPAEHVLAVGPLLPPAAGRLFMERANRAAPQALPSLDEDKVLELCQRLEGLPLVIELAAARLAALSFDDLAARLDGALDLLGSGERSHDRQRSLRATLNWSYELLTADEQALYRAVSVLRGPFRLGVAEELLPAQARARVAAGVAHLVDASLLVRLEDRYRQLELVRADARERLRAAGEENAVNHRLVDWALAAVDKGLSHGDEHDLAAAVEAAQELGRPEFTDLALGLARAWEERGHGHWSDAEMLYESAAVASKEPKIAIRGADLAWSRSHGTRAVALFELATELAVPAGDPAAEAYATSGTVELMGRFGCYADRPCDPQVTSPLVERSWSAAEAAGDPCSRARALLARTWRRDWGAPDVERMGLDAERSLLAARECGDMSILSSALDGWCSVALKRLDMPTAQAAIAERLEITQRFDPHQARQFLERFDAVHMSCELGCILGRFDDALAAGRVLDELGRGRGIIFGGATQLAPALFFLGQFDQCLQQVSGAFAEALQRPGTGNSMLLRALCCAAAICGYRGDHAAAAEWWAQADAVASARHGKEFFIKMMRADVLLHHGRRQAAAELLAEPPSALVSPWRGWYGAVRAEALGPVAFADAEAVAEGGIYSAAVLARARGRLDEALALFTECGAAYQAARTALCMNRAESTEARARYAEWGLATATQTVSKGPQD